MTIVVNAVVGFGWAYFVAGDEEVPATFELVVATTHPTLGRDSHQNPDPSHVHTATLDENLACVVSLDSTSESGLSINQNSMNVRIQNADLPSDFSVNVATGFTLNGDVGCPAVHD